MKTWFAVIASYYDNGRVTANLIDIREADEKPESTMTELKKCDCYVEWFESLKEANEYIKECLNA